MTSGNYTRHFKLLGKLAYLYDQATSKSNSLATGIAVFAEQYSDGTAGSLPVIKMMDQYVISMSSNTGSGVAAQAVKAAGTYLTSSLFTGDLTTTPASSSIAGVLTALATDMSSGVDNKTLSTKSSTGLVNFFDTLSGTTGTWNTVTDASADYKDSVLCVGTLVS